MEKTVRAQWLLGEVLLPQPWRELGDSAGWVLAYALQDVDEVRVRLDARAPAGRDQALHDAGVLGADRRLLTSC